MNDSQADYAAIRRRVAGRMRRHLFFWVHLVVYLFGICAFSSNLYSAGIIVVWGIVIMAHFARAYGVDLWRGWVEAATQTEIQRMERLGLTDAMTTTNKPKRGEKTKHGAQAVRLTHDGELADVPSDVPSEEVPDSEPYEKPDYSQNASSRP